MDRSFIAQTLTGKILALTLIVALISQRFVGSRSSVPYDMITWVDMGEICVYSVILYMSYP